MPGLKCPAKAHVQLIVLWPSSQSGLDSIPASSFYSSLLFLLLPPLFCCPNRTTDPASVSATTATTIGRRKGEKGEGIKKTTKNKGGEEIGAREVEKGHHKGDVSEVILVTIPTFARSVSRLPACCSPRRRPR